MPRLDEDPDDISPDTGDISQDCRDNNHDECDGTLEPALVADCECPCHNYSDNDVE